MNPEICEMLLPTEEGFFFGGTNYDEWYIQNVEETITMFEEVIKEHKELLATGLKEFDISYCYNAWY